MFDQLEFEKYLRQEVLSHSNITASIRYAAVDIADISDDASVLIESLPTEKQETKQQDLIGRYVLGADGAASFVRRSIGSGWQDLGINVDWLVVDVITKPGHTLNNATLQVFPLSVGKSITCSIGMRSLLFGQTE